MRTFWWVLTSWDPLKGCIRVYWGELIVLLVSFLLQFCAKQWRVTGLFYNLKNMLCYIYCLKEKSTKVDKVKMMSIFATCVFYLINSKLVFWNLLTERHLPVWWCNVTERINRTKNCLELDDTNKLNIVNLRSSTLSTRLNLVFGYSTINLCWINPSLKVISH